MRTSINKWNHLDQKSCWENLSQQQQTSRLQCEELRTHEQRRQRSNSTVFFSHLSSSYLLFCDNQQSENNRSNDEWSRHYQADFEFNIKFFRSSTCRRTRNIWSVNIDKRFFLFHINVAWARLTKETNSIFIEMWLKRSVFLNTQLKKIFTWLLSLTLSQRHRISINIRRSYSSIRHFKSFTCCIDVFVLIENKADMNRVLNCRHD